MEYILNKEKHLDCCMKISAIDEEERSVTAVISSGAVDRDREVLMPKGMDAEEFQKNPVVLWAHDSGSPPIGKALWIKTKGQKITAKVKFALTEFAEEIFQLFKGGFLKAFSVGFIPHDGHPPTPKEIARNPELAEARYIVSDWELLEFSAVPIPANPEALMQAIKSKKLTLSDSTKEIFQEAIPEEDFEKHLDCEIKQVEDEIEPTVELEPIETVELVPIVKLEPLKSDKELAEEAINILKGKMY
jgi:HK97 family phage prohead protease